MLMQWIKAPVLRSLTTSKRSNKFKVVCHVCKRSIGFKEAIKLPYRKLCNSRFTGIVFFPLPARFFRLSGHQVADHFENIPGMVSIGSGDILVVLSVLTQPQPGCLTWHKNWNRKLSRCTECSYPLKKIKPLGLLCVDCVSTPASTRLSRLHL